MLFNTPYTTEIGKELYTWVRRTFFLQCCLITAFKQNVINIVLRRCPFLQTFECSPSPTRIPADLWRSVLRYTDVSSPPQEVSGRRVCSEITPQNQPGKMRISPRPALPCAVESSQLLWLQRELKVLWGAQCSIIFKSQMKTLCQKSEINFSDGKMV